MAKFKIEGVKELDIKLSRFSNFLGQEYNTAMEEIGKYGTKTFRKHIEGMKTDGGQTWKSMIDLTDTYKEIKRKRWGWVYPILYASGKMYRDIKHTRGISVGAFKSRKMTLGWGFKTKRSEKLADIHANKGIWRKRGDGFQVVIRDPFFFTRGEKSWIINLLNKATKNALRKARLKRARLKRA